MADDDFVTSATLVAVTVTDCVEVMEDGAVYKPLDERVPTLGFMVQVTAVLPAEITVAANCCDCELNRLAVGGVTLTATGTV